MQQLLQAEDWQRIVMTALAEDIGHGDITSQSVITDYVETSMQCVARETMVVCGASLIGLVFHAIAPDVEYEWFVDDGTAIESGQIIASVSGNAQTILAGERVALNLLQRMCGIATQTANYVRAVEGTQAIILDTRKTMPGLRALDKYAVKAGGGQNHRMRLDDAILIKDNHIAIVGSVTEAVKRAKANAPATMRIEVECDTLDQVKDAVLAGADMLLLDNMDSATLREAVAIAKGKAECEASGNVTLETVRSIAETGVHYISIGRLTHSVRNVDIGLDRVGE